MGSKSLYLLEEVEDDEMRSIPPDFNSTSCKLISSFCGRCFGCEDCSDKTWTFGMDDDEDDAVVVEDDDNGSRNRMSCMAATNEESETGVILVPMFYEYGSLRVWWDILSS